MKKRTISILVILTVLAGLFSYPGGQVKSVQAADISTVAGIAAWTDLDGLSLDQVKPVFLSVDYLALDGSYLVGKIDLPVYEAEYNPLVMVNTDGLVVAYYPRENYAGKLVDVIGKQLNETLLEKAVKLVAVSVGSTTPTINHYDFAHPEATNLLLIAEDKADGSTFTLNLPSSNLYSAKSYAFYQSYSASFTIDNDTIDQVSFVASNADFTGEGIYGTIFGHFGDPYSIDIPLGVSNTFTVWSDGIHAYGALAILHNNMAVIQSADADAIRDIPLVFPGLVEVSDNLIPSAPDKMDPSTSTPDARLDLTLSWKPSTAPSYEYCIDTSNDAVCDTGWVATSATSVSLANLFFETTYYWQVRAVNSFGSTEADDGSWWSFTTEDYQVPASFDKHPAMLTERPGSSSRVKLSWDPSYGAYYYEYCLDTEPQCTAPEVWRNVKLATSVTSGELAFDQTYYWQVRAVNDDGSVIAYTDANGPWEAFTTRRFGKLRPTNNALISYTSVPLEWEASAAAESYAYCVSKTNGVCDSGWKNVGSETKATLTKLSLNTTYYWQVKALASGVELFADSGTWWSFKTPASKKAVPTLFKVSPVDLAVEVSLAPVLDWKDYKNFVSYQYCYFDVDNTDTTPISVDDTCTHPDFYANWVDTAKNSTATLTALAGGTTYYWQVRVNIGTEEAPVWVYGDHDEYWSFTTAP